MADNHPPQDPTPPSVIAINYATVLDPYTAYPYYAYALAQATPDISAWVQLQVATQLHMQSSPALLVQLLRPYLTPGSQPELLSYVLSAALAIADTPLATWIISVLQQSTDPALKPLLTDAAKQLTAILSRTQPPPPLSPPPLTHQPWLPPYYPPVTRPTYPSITTQPDPGDSPPPNIPLPPYPATQSTRPQHRYQMSNSLKIILTVAATFAVFIGVTHYHKAHNNFAAPTNSPQCQSATTAQNGSITIPINIYTNQANVELVVNLCFGGQGPYPFVVDTGAQQTMMVTGLAQHLGLTQAGPDETFGGVGNCTTSAQVYSVSNWTASGMPLRPQQVASWSTAGLGAPGEPDGLLGADVWSSFGAVKFNFANKTLTVPGKQQYNSSQSSANFTGPNALPVPSSLTAGPTTATVPLHIQELNGSARATTAVQFTTSRNRTTTEQMEVDTGTSQTTLNTATAMSLGLKKAPGSNSASTACGTTVTTYAHSGHWALLTTSATSPHPGANSATPLSPQVISTTKLGNIGSPSLTGLLGADTLADYRWVVLSFNSGVLVLGPHK